MSRSVFEQLRADVHEALRGVSFRLEREVYDYGSFGSAHAEWVRRGEAVQLVWDGKDRWLSLASSRSGGWFGVRVGNDDELRAATRTLVVACHTLRREVTR